MHYLTKYKMNTRHVFIRLPMEATVGKLKLNINDWCIKKWQYD